MSIAITEHEEAKRETEVNALPKIVVNRSDFRKLAKRAGWSDDTIKRYIANDWKPSDRYIKVGSDAVRMI